MGGIRWGMKENLPAILTLLGTIFVAVSARIWGVTDKRKEAREQEAKKYQRYEKAFSPLMHYARQLKQSVIAVNIRMKTDSDYATIRLDELANEDFTILNELRDFVEGRIEYPKQ